MWRSVFRASRDLSRDQSGASTVEFALVVTPFIAMIVAVVESLSTQYYSSALDHAVQRFAYDVRSGAVILGGSSAMTAQGVKDSLALLLPSSFTPAKLQVKLVTRNCSSGGVACWRPDYANYTRAIRPAPTFDSSASLPFNIGAAGASQYLTVYYPAPSLSSLWSNAAPAIVNGERVFGILSAAMWTNDPSVGVF